MKSILYCHYGYEKQIASLPFAVVFLFFQPKNTIMSFLLHLV